MSMMNNLAGNFTPEVLKIYSLAVAKAVAILFFGWWFINRASKLAALFLSKACVDLSVASFLSSLLKFSMRVVLLVLVMSQLKFDVTSIITAMGASLIAVGISLKESLSNFVSGIVLVITRPIHMGDFIEFENFSGTVIKMEMLFTTLQTEEEGKTVVIPNGKLISNAIVKRSKYEISNIRCKYTLKGKFKNKDIDKFLIKEFILNKNILNLPEPEVKIESLNENELNLEISVWSQNQYALNVRENIDKAISKVPGKYEIEKRE